MKKIFTLILFATLLIGLLTACSADDADIVAEYRALEAVFLSSITASDMTYTVTSERQLELIPVDGAVLHRIRIQSADWEADTFKENIAIYNEAGDLIFETGTIYVDGERYSPIGVLAFDDDILDNLDIPELLAGEYTHLQQAAPTLDHIRERFSEVGDRIGINGAFSDEILENHLQRDGNTFRLTFEGDAAYTHLEPVIEELQYDGLSVELHRLYRAVNIEDDLAETLQQDFLAWLREADFSDAQIVIERTQVDADTRSQVIEIYIPDRISTRTELIVVNHYAMPIVQPERFLTVDALFAYIDSFMDESRAVSTPDFVLNWSEMTANALHDLPTITLLDHDVEESELLGEHMLASLATQEIYHIATIDLSLDDAGFEFLGLDRAFFSLGAVEIMYALMSFDSALTALEPIVEFDVHNLQAGGFALSENQPLRLSADEQTAVFSLQIHDAAPPSLYIYIVQEVPNSGYVLLLRFVCFTRYWDDSDTALFEAFSELFGFDLMTYLP